MSETDISTAAVERLAKRLRDHGHSGKGGILPVTLALLADRDRLAAEVARLREALANIAVMGFSDDPAVSKRIAEIAVTDARSALNHGDAHAARREGEA